MIVIAIDEQWSLLNLDREKFFVLGTFHTSKVIPAPALTLRADEAVSETFQHKKCSYVVVPVPYANKCLLTNTASARRP